MTKKHLFSFALATACVAVTASITMAQTGRPGFVPQKPRFTPPPSVHQDRLVKPTGFQEEVKVPEVLSGKQAGSANKAAGQQPSAIPQPPNGMPAFQPSPKQIMPKPPTVMPRQDSGGQSTLGANPIPTGVIPGNLPAAQQTMAPKTDPDEFSNTATDPPASISPVSNLEPFKGNRLRTRPIDTSGVRSEFQPPQVDTQFAKNSSFGVDAEPIRGGASSLAGTQTTEGPKLRVTSTGPSSITIGKSARYEIKVENPETRSANGVIVGIDLPEWIEITSVLPSTGNKETTDGQQESLMVWQIPIVEAMTSEKIVIDVIPREARPFDIDVEWTFKPIRGKTTIEVTQPQLAIQIAGPTEVQFGEKALYDVTVSNPGTGVAENVNVMLPEALGGERARLDNIEPQRQKKFQVELIARSAGKLDLTTTVLADGNLKESDTREIIVRRAVLDIALQGPPLKYAGSEATYSVTVSNKGDAMARDVIAAIALPAGVDFVSGIDNVEKIDGGVRWNVGMLSPGNQRTYQLTCNMAVAGDISVDAATRGAGDLAATDTVKTKVDAVADLVLSVQDPKGPLPTGKEIEYEIRIRNRGTKSAKVINVVMHFSDGVEPISGNGIANEIAPGQITFSPISQIDPDQDIVLKVKAMAKSAGSHRFRAQLLCEEADSHEVAEGTTRFFGETTTSTAENETRDDGQFKR